MNYLGVDLGTSAVKLLLVDQGGKVQNSISIEYPLSFPKPGWAEQKPEDWWQAVKWGIAELVPENEICNLAGIGSGGQMHGLVALDENDKVLRPAILWNDGRTQHQVDYLNNYIGKEKLSQLTANIAFAGFTAPKILWMKQNEPELFERISKIMLPKDYINYKLTGQFCTDYSDASGMLLLDVENKKWSEEMLTICDITEDQLPKLYESYETVGSLSPQAIKEIWGDTDQVCQAKVVAGAGDNAAAAVGTGTVFDGACNISLGTSGTIFISADEFGVDSNNALHSFAHSNGKFHLMGCMLSAASCNKWLCEEILKTVDFAKEQKDITDDKLGTNTVFYLPYLMGERSPINDVNARATFTGMTMDSTRSDMVQAMLEGVAFAIKDSFEVAKSLGLEIKASKLCGGGAKSPLWQKIFANVLNIDLELPVAEEGPGFGGAMLAMVGLGLYETVQDCAEAIVKTKKTIHPTKTIAERYAKQYEKYKKIYPALKPVFADFAEEE